MAFSFLQRGNLTEAARQLSLSSYVPAIVLEDLVAGIDNVRHDVFISSRFSETARAHIFRLIAKHGGVEDLASEGSLFSVRESGRPNGRKAPDAAEFKRQFAELHVMALNRAKNENNPSLDLLFRLAVIKFERSELTSQFNQVLERCRARVKQYEGPRQTIPAKAVEVRDRLAQFQINKRAILRRAGQDLFLTLRDVEKESLARHRRSLLGDVAPAAYDLFLNRLIFMEDGRDDFLNAEHYVMLGNYERDADRFQRMREIAGQFLRSLPITGDAEPEIDALLNVPENAQELMGGGVPDDAASKG